MNQTTLSLWAATVLAMGLGATTAQAQPTPQHVANLAARMERESKAVLRDVRHHLRTSPQYRAVYGDVYAMYDLASHIHEVAVEDGNLDHLSADVKKLDDLFHHVEEVLDVVERSGQVDPLDMRFIRSAVDRMGETLHLLEKCVSPTPAPPPPPAPAPPPVLVPPVRLTPPGMVLRLNYRFPWHCR